MLADLVDPAVQAAGDLADVQRGEQRAEARGAAGDVLGHARALELGDARVPRLAVAVVEHARAARRPGRCTVPREVVDRRRDLAAAGGGGAAASASSAR